MPETIHKLQPDRTLALRGFDGFASAATIHHASPDGFTISGTFRDPADFAVAVLYDADNFYEHPRLKYLPDFDFSGLNLSFNVLYSDGVQPIDSPKSNWIDWATLDCILADGSKPKIPLWQYATLVDSTFPVASATVNVTTSSQIQAFDRITLWYQNLAFDYIVPEGNTAVEFAFFAGGTGATHFININGRIYSHTESDPHGESSADQAGALIAAIAGDPEVSASHGSAAHKVLLTVRPSATGAAIPVSASDGNGSAIMRYTTPEIAASALVDAINVTDWNAAGSPQALLASANGSAITLTAGRYGIVNVSGDTVTWVSGAPFAGLKLGSNVQIANTSCSITAIHSPTEITVSGGPGSASNLSYAAPRGGSDGNLIQLYALSRAATLALDRNTIQLTGGSSHVTWNVALDFTALRIDQLRQCWLTFAPALTFAPFAATEWQAEFSNWTLSGPEATKTLQVAGPGSVRIESESTACVWSGIWSTESGFYSKYFAKANIHHLPNGQVVVDPTATVTVTYNCQFTHGLYLGTSLDSDRAVASITIDGIPQKSLDCRLSGGSAVVTRRLLKPDVAPGKHTVHIGIETAGVLYFDFLEAAVPSDIPAPLDPRTGISPALDFDTDHTYKLSPSRLLWNFDQLGFAGPINEYLGVFWWNERTLTDGFVSSADVTFSGTFAGGDLVLLNLNGSVIRKSVFPADTPATIARHFAAYINSTFVGAWATATGNVLTVTSRSAAPDYALTVSVSTTSAQGVATVTRGPTLSSPGTWVVDDTVSPPLNRATRDWHSDFYAQCAARGREVTTACSMELVYPPPGCAARFSDGTEVQTSTGFGSLKSQHCAIGSSRMLSYQKAVYRALAGLQSAAELIPSLQYGEFLWWFLPGVAGMAFYDDETLAAASATLGRPLHLFATPNDDPAVNAPDALFLRNRLRDYLAALTSDIRSAYPNVTLELLWPYDVNHPTPVPLPAPYLGGRLNRYINLPAEWQIKATSGFDRIKTEALAFASGMRNLDLADEAIHLFRGFGWPANSLRYLVPVFGIAMPWHKEIALAKGAGIPILNLWAWDHICLYNLSVPEQGLDRRSFASTA